MTRQRYDEHSTEFGLWLRKQPEIDSGLGFVTTNLDYIWANYKSGSWMLIEEKRYRGAVKFSQRQLFKKIACACRNAKGYCGIHLLEFEMTSPDDGRMWLDRVEISKEQLIAFLRFEE